MQQSRFTETELSCTVKEQDAYRPVPFGLAATALWKASSVPLTGLLLNFRRPRAERTYWRQLALRSG